MTSRWPLTGVYAITPDVARTSLLAARVQAVLEGGIQWLQYRNKSADERLRREQVLALQPLCAHYGVPLIVNDHWQLAVELGADGAHLGMDDGSLAQARAALPRGALLGASCYQSLDLAQRAVEAGADYVAFGAFHPSSTKPDARPAPRSLLTESVTLRVPRVAIGGITPDNARSLVDAGADLLAVVSGVFGAADPGAAVRAYRACFPLPDAASSR